MTESHLSRVGAPLRAPALSVRGLGPAEVTVAGLTAGGGALLLFVSEECPTSAMALRRLGPLCGAWQEAGLTATAVFEDPLEVAVRVARRLGWQAGVAAEDPPYRTSRACRLVSVPTAVLVDRAGTIAGTVTGWDHAALVALIGRAGALLGAELAIPEATEPLLKPFFFSSRRRHTRWTGDWSSDVCSSDLTIRSGLMARSLARASAAVSAVL